jgi:hypothetical protein
MKRTLLYSVLGTALLFLVTVIYAQTTSETKPYQFCLMGGQIIPPINSKNDKIKFPPASSIRITNLGSSVNTKGLEYAPVISNDGTTMYYISDRDGSVLNKNGKNSHDIWALNLKGKGATKENEPYNIAPTPKFGEYSVNTLRNEGIVTLAHDKQRIYFTGCSRPDGKGDCDLYYSDLLPDGSWGWATNCGNVNSFYFDSQPSLSPDGKRLYFVSNRPHSRKTQTKALIRAVDSLDTIIKELEPDLHMRALLLRRGIDTSKVEMEKYNLVIKEITDKHPDIMKEVVSLSEKIVKNERHDTGRYLNNNNTNDLEQISMGLWYSEWNVLTNTWDVPDELTELNTSGKDISPFICADNCTLIFASDGHPNSLGGLDFYVTRQNDDGSWQTPVNLGAPINTKGDDMFIALSDANGVAYFSSTRTDIKGAQDNLDLYMAYVIQDCTSGDITTKTPPSMNEDSTIKVVYVMVGNTVTMTTELSEAETLTLKIYNIVGKEMMTCINKQSLKAGKHSIPLQLGELESGEYFFHLESESAGITNGFVISR